MNSLFRFPRRVRIHGGECGAVARALHHEAQNDALMTYEQTLVTTEKTVLRQADSGKALGSTFIERKQMSTKTTLKRIALVAVSALSFGLLSSVVPAQATGASELPTSIAVGTKESHRTTAFANTNIVLNLPSTAAAGDTVVVGVGLLTCPATSTLCSVSANPTQSAYTGITNESGARLTWAAGPSGSSGSFGSLSGNPDWSTSGSATATAVYTINASDSAGQITLRVQFKPDVSGTYSFLVSTPNAITDIKGDADSNTTGYYTPSSTDTSTSYTITTTSAATSATLTAVTTGAGSGSGIRGTIYKMSLSDGTNSTILGSTESITLTSSDSSVSFAAPNGAVSTSATSLVITGGDTTYLSGGSYYFRVDNSSTSSESVTITATGSGTLSSSVTASSGIAFTAVSTSTAAYTSVDGTAGGDDTSAVLASGGTTTPSYTVASGDSSHSLRATITTKAAQKSAWECTDTSAKITGFTNAVFSRVITHTAADTNAYVDISVSATLLVVNNSGQSFTCSLTGASASRTITFTAATAAATTLTVTDSSRRVATGSTNSFTVELDDDYGSAMSNKTIVVTIAGRNGATASSSIVTDSAGKITYSLTDTGTVGTSDTITFTHTPTSGSAVTATATLTYGTTTVTTLSVYTAPHVAAGVADTNIIYSDKKDIDASSTAGAAATTQTVTVLAKDANAVVMAGVPVTFTIAGTGCGLLSTKGMVYTGSDGYASTSIYAWLEGKCTVTATAGGQTATTDAYFVQTGADEARTITAAVSGGLVTATVKDRFGNPIKGVYVYATRTGEGYFGNGSSSTSGTTDEAGKVEFYLNGNATATTVKVQLGSSTAASDEFGQSSADAGKKGTKSATQTAFTAYAAGTTTTAETGVGSSLAPAGVNSATVTVAAATNAAADAANAANDAAAEAIDAANAATDAANLAAEAADAATVAAEEARDAADAATAAVEELATQVATLMAALKAQITTLANTVAKIAKKVKA